LFEGPRVLWTDGAHPEEGVKAVYAEKSFSFQHSLAVLSAPDTFDGRLTARFLTAYLRSPMGVWLLLLLSSSVASERPKLHVQEALDWPFWTLENHPYPEHARSIMQEVDILLSDVEMGSDLQQPHMWASLQPHINKLIYKYFNLTEEDIALIEELSSFAGPAIQPSSLRHSALMRPLRQIPSYEMMQEYCQVLVTTLCRWRDVTGGTGSISASPWSGRTVPIGAAVIYLDQESQNDRLGDDSIIQELAAALSRVTASADDTLMTIPDVALVDGKRIFLIKPMVSRFWLRRRAIEDASHLALQLQSISKVREHA
jgi:hypothetical protein